MDKILLTIIGGSIIAVIGLLAVSGVSFEDTNDNKGSSEFLLDPKDQIFNWHSSGPFHINKKVYDIGESIFMRVETLQPEEKGQIALLHQTNDTHYKIWKTESFDGSKKQFFNQYWTPRLSVPTKICSAEDISGKWIMVFKNTNYPNLEFEFTDKIITGEEESYDKTVC